MNSEFETSTTKSFLSDTNNSPGLASGKIFLPPASPRLRSSVGSSSIIKPDDGSSSFIKPSKGRRQNSMAEYTVNKLKFQDVGFYGRENEIASLQKVLQRSKEKVGKQIVFMKGYSGTGKSALANTLKSPVYNDPEKRGLLVKGKFDLHLRNEPYSGIAEAGNDICNAILGLRYSDPERFEIIQARIKKALGEEALILTMFIASLADVTSPYPSSSSGDHAALNQVREERAVQPSDEKPSVIVDQSSVYRLNYAFQRFIRAISESFTPFIFLLDDLQWSDASSLDLLEVLFADEENISVMFVGIYRSNEVNEEHQLARVIKNARARAETSERVALHDINVDNLDFGSVHQYVEAVLSMTNPKTYALAEICFKKTLGNPFYLYHFLSKLHKEAFLKYSFGLMEWTWDETDIEHATKASENVVELLKAKMKGLSDELTEVLQLAACLGASFEEMMLFRIWQGMEETTSPSRSIERFNEILDIFQEEGYLHLIADNSIYGFSHDKVQEAANELLSTEEQFRVHHKVGLFLMSYLSSTQLEDEYVFVVVNLLNGGGQPGSSLPEVALAEMNQKASKKAMSLSAFQAASEYASKGIKLIEKHGGCWESLYDLMLDLYSTGAEAASFLGDFDRLEEYYQEVVNEKSVPLSDKLRVYTVYINSVGSQRSLTEAADMAFDLLAQFGCVFPKRKLPVLFGVFSGLRAARTKLRRGEYDNFGNLPDDTDPVRKQLLVILDKLVIHLFMVSDPRVSLVCLRLLQWTQEYGLNEYSAVALTLTGIFVQGILGDVLIGVELVKRSLPLAPKFSRLTESRNSYCAHAHSLHWVQPLRETATGLRKAYEMGMRAGNVENGLWAIQKFCFVRLVSNCSLDLLQEDIKKYVLQMRDLKREFHVHLTSTLYQFVAKITSKDDENFETLTGDVITVEDYEQWSNTNFMFISYFDVFQCYLLMLYGKHTSSIDRALKRGLDITQRVLPGIPLLYTEALVTGLSAFAVARMTRKRVYIRAARKMQTRVKSWIKLGCPNVIQYDALFDAEMAALRGKHEKARARYEMAIQLSARGGFLIDAAICAERLSEFLLERGNLDDASYRLEQAARYYSEVGAHRKASMLRDQQVKSNYEVNDASSALVF